MTIFLTIIGLIILSVISRSFVIHSTSHRESQILFKHILYYRNLSPKQKQIFTFRVKRFIGEKRFISKSQEEVPYEAQVLVAASAVRLTFGLKRYMLNSFPNIIIYPDEYYSRFTQTYNKGETNPMGYIVLSWKAFEFGNQDDDDNLNLGLHEFAHALYVESSKDYLDDDFYTYYDEWSRLLVNRKRYNKIVDEQIFREYALTNQFELFAVAIETFFESPEMLKEKLPRVYRTLCLMLNQDPTKRSNPVIKSHFYILLN